MKAGTAFGAGLSKVKDIEVKKKGKNYVQLLTRHFSAS